MNEKGGGLHARDAVFSRPAACGNAARDEHAATSFLMTPEHGAKRAREQIALALMSTASVPTHLISSQCLCGCGEGVFCGQQEKGRSLVWVTPQRCVLGEVWASFLS